MYYEYYDGIRTGSKLSVQSRVIKNNKKEKNNSDTMMRKSTKQFLFPLVLRLLPLVLLVVLVLGDPDIAEQQGEYSYYGVDVS